MSNAAAVWGRELLRWRGARGMTQTQLAAAVPCNQSVISELERGLTFPTDRIAIRLDAVLATGGILERNLEYVTREVNNFYPNWFQRYVELEAKALTLQAWHAFEVPGMLQTEEYARGQFTLWGHPPKRVEEMTAARLSRQRIMFGEGALRFSVLLDESVLRRQVGGARVMVNQLRHMLEMSRRPNVIVQVVPLGRPLLTTLNATVILLGMPDGRSWFYTESLAQGQITNDRTQVAGFAARYDRVRASALPVQESRDVIRRAIGEVVNVNPTFDLSEINIFKSSYSGGDAGCVGTSRDLLSVGIAPVVDTTLGDRSPVLPFSTAAFASFVAAVKAGDPAFAFGEQYVTP
ncbi:helix-turn-helix transcriptional regulator [Streptacidiphilus sp. P02-A3a]|uniref:helix-turn-helix domain-containing protein n=1 Tax=Streptacidiphilus sp. P02-A3a TaxID=2704468 RepID=UPI0015FCFC76|nr:helix-turn-helix transcriptional regulator [Streptacidiphilus sp. P02-A3a]QMU71097.1 helix-turn-helix domain-containing protein [Streptacidiphilus sp. P02-A3a]